MSLLFQGCSFVRGSGFRLRFLSGRLGFTSLCLVTFFLEGLGKLVQCISFFLLHSLFSDSFFLQDYWPAALQGVGSPRAVRGKERSLFPSCACIEAIVFHSPSCFGFLPTLLPWAKELLCRPCETVVAVLILFEVLP